LDNAPGDITAAGIGRRNRTRIETMALIPSIARNGVMKTQLICLGNLSSK
jgi:hypothetical protein